MDASLDAIVAALAAEQAQLSGLLAGLDGAGWQRASRCEGWSVADVVLHLAQTNELSAASAEGGLRAAVDELAGGRRPGSSVDDGADALVARERGQPGSEVYDRWRRSADDVCRLLRSCDPHRRVDWVTGELSVRTLATTRLAETWIHGGDVGWAFGTAPPASDRLWHIARLAWRTLPYASRRAGRQPVAPVAFRLRGPDGDGWDFLPDSEPVNTVRGEALELCLVAARRVDPRDTSLVSDGPDPVLELVRTYA